MCNGNLPQLYCGHKIYFIKSKHLFQQAGTCFCGDFSYGIEDLHNELDCDKNCAGDPTEMCGGRGPYMSVFYAGKFTRGYFGQSLILVIYFVVDLFSN